MLEHYTGRFAPSPTGPLHFGSLVAAVASYLDAKHHQGTWLLRIEDLDPPRESKTALSEILFALDRFGLRWDEDILFQSKRLEHYQHSLDKLSKDGLLYPCTCSRKKTTGVYQRYCINQPFDNINSPYAVRIKTDNRRIEIQDRLHGSKSWNLQKEIGDFIIKRKDGLFAYQLAVVLDDAQQKVNQVVRGTDLLDSTPRQIFLQSALGLDTPHYTHVPIIVHADGSKLSKQTGASAIDTRYPLPTLIKVLTVLGQELPPDDMLQTPTDCLDWAGQHWHLQKIPKVLELLEN